MSLRNAASERQVQAADPAFSTWLSANAGSGKTRVLTDRVARLLLDGVPPARVLCLTFTKAAASEMQNRLFSRLGAWAMLEDAALRDELRTLGAEAHAEAPDLGAARTLFARAIETPGGLKIQTIHSFCASLLRRFPLEAGVSPQFTEIDDRAAELLRAEIVEEMAAGAAPEAVADLAAHYTQDDLGRFSGEIVRHRPAFARTMEADQVWTLYGLAPGATAAELQRDLLTGDETALIARAIPILEAGKSTDAKVAAALRVAPATIEGLAGALLTKAGTPIQKFPTKAIQAEHPDLAAELMALAERVAEGRRRALALAGAERTLALHRFARAFLALYDAQKASHGWLDFDDLILKAAALLTDPAVAAWVLFRLDGGIDHILVDEAQDTSPEQWQVIELLAQEFTAGAGARSDVERTIFVVGDKKQSIYAFQGADPEAFDRMRGHFGDRLSAVARPFQSLQLEYSFRSSDPILRLTDLTFDGQVSAGLGDVLHLAFHSDLPGRVDLWPLVPPAEKPEPGAWYDPVDRVGSDHHDVRLGAAIAAEIARMLADETLPERDGTRRPVRPGDIMILVRRRQRLFHEIIRACKAHGLPMAGADRLRIGGELAVRDLTALMSFLATPEDDLSLAAALRSPLFGWSEAALYDLAAERSETYLWAALRARGETFTETLGVLDALRSEADFLRPFELLERILTRHGGRGRLLARLGPEAEDGIDALLAQALAYERMDIPSLTGFLTWIESGDVEIKRQVDQASDQIRVMTVHGAKGLEAPIVFLPDTCVARNDVKDDLLPAEDGTILWKTRKDQAPDVVQVAIERQRARQTDERLRLLYVAMTRAERWLVVCGAGDPGQSGATWYELVQAGMDAAGAVAEEMATGRGWRLAHGDWEAGPVAAPVTATRPRTELPAWAWRAAPVPDVAPKTLAPSELGGAKALPGEDGQTGDAALRYGRQLHRLLEHLPGHPERAWPEIAPALLSTGEDAADESTAARLLADAARVLRNPALAEVFAGDALTEVEISAEVPALGGRIHGTIDRLIVRPALVTAIDFKSNAVLPETPEATPEGLLRQMAAYLLALEAIYPDRMVDCALLWTRAPVLMPLPHELLRATCESTAIP